MSVLDADHAPRAVWLAAVLQVVDADGDIVARIGARVRLNGRAYELEEAEKLAEIPEACRETGVPTGSPATDKWFLVSSSPSRSSLGAASVTPIGARGS